MKAPKRSPVVKTMVRLMALPAFIVMAGLTGWAGERKDAAGEMALKKRAADYVAAFNKGDATAVAAFYTLDADYVDPSGTTFGGRKAIENAFKKQFTASKGGKLLIHPTAARFLKPDLVLEDGTTEVVYPDAPPIASRYTAVLIQQDGQWYVASMRATLAMPASNHQYLSDLAWLTGDWVDETEKGEADRVSYAWAENDNFLVASFATTLKDVPIAGGTQWIGWDSAGKQIRSWAFYSNGGFSEGTWSGTGDKWTIKATTTTRDGKKLSATNILTRIDGDHATWQSVKRTLDGKEIPDTAVIKMKRAK